VNSPYSAAPAGRVVATFHGGYATVLDGAVRPADESRVRRRPERRTWIVTGVVARRRRRRRVWLMVRSWRARTTRDEAPSAYRCRRRSTRRRDRGALRRDDAAAQPLERSPCRASRSAPRRVEVATRASSCGSAEEPVFLPADRIVSAARPR
jgi:hypothetical protein